MAENYDSETFDPGISTYAVGLLYDLQLLWRALFVSGWSRGAGIRSFFYKVRLRWRKKSYWNGYLAEWHYQPEDVILYKCGKGWTRKAALRRLGENLVNDNRGLDKRHHPGIRVQPAHDRGYIARWFMAPVEEGFFRPTEIFGRTPQQALKRYGKQLVALNLNAHERSR